jgi:hypothetical protein
MKNIFKNIGIVLFMITVLGFIAFILTGESDKELREYELPAIKTPIVDDNTSTPER